MKVYKFTRKELKGKRASDFEHVDSIEVGRYVIRIRCYDSGHGQHYARPSLLSWVEDIKTGKILDCTPGIGTPYYIDDFLGR